MKLTALLLAALSFLAPVSRSQDASHYAPWKLGPPTDPEWFPIGVWLQDPRLADRYAALGVNTFVGLWKGPTEEQLAQLKAAEMKIVCSLNKVGRAHKDDPSIIAWMQVDEPDNSDGGKPKATPQRIQETYERMRKFDPDRPVWLNLGQGVANDEWKGRGAKRSDYPGYARGTDILSFDVYPVTNIGKSDGENYLWYVAKGVRRLREWSDDRAIVWNFVECTRGRQKTKKATPAQVRSEVWLGIVAGSRGIVWFCHEFEPDVKPAALLADPVMSQAVARINAEVLSYAPVLNRPTVEKVTVRPEKRSAPIGILAKEYEGALYVFAVAQRNEAGGASFGVHGYTGKVEVLGEDRELEIVDGRFEDSFGPFEVHVYRVER